MSGRGGAPGFTLLEVVVAMAILVLSLMAVFNLNSGAIAMHSYAKKLTVATQLARSKMEDVQQELYDKGFSLDDEEKDGDFSEEGWAMYKWRARIIAPKLDGLSPEQLITALFGIPLGKDGLASLFGGGDKSAGASSSSGPTNLAPGMMGPSGLEALGPMGGMMQGQIQQMVDQLSKTVREVRLTVSWRDGKQVESVDLVTHVVSMGPGGDRNGNPAQQQINQLQNPNGQVPGTPPLGASPLGTPPVGGGQPFGSPPVQNPGAVGR